MFLRHEMMFEDFYRFYGYMTVVIMNYSIMLNHIHMSSRQNPLHLSSCYCYGYHFWGALSLSRVLWKSAYSRSNMEPKSIPKQARKWIEQLFCWFQVLRQHFMFLSCCINLHAALICMHFPSFSFHLHASSFRCAFISFRFPFVFLHVPFIGNAKSGLINPPQEVGTLPCRSFS